MKADLEGEMAGQKSSLNSKLEAEVERLKKEKKEALAE